MKVVKWLMSLLAWMGTGVAFGFLDWKLAQLGGTGGATMSVVGLVALNFLPGFQVGILESLDDRGLFPSNLLGIILVVLGLMLPAFALGSGVWAKLLFGEVESALESVIVMVLGFTVVIGGKFLGNYCCKHTLGPRVQITEIL
ncbi:MAG TPA: hypothetical protein VEA59_02580 [Patescibacteria group bacterium]|nr:hypothetical protein [Patescibacteria group bacterium]